MKIHYFIYLILVINSIIIIVKKLKFLFELIIIKIKIKLIWFKYIILLGYNLKIFKISLLKIP